MAPRLSPQICLDLKYYELKHYSTAYFTCFVAATKSEAAASFRSLSVCNSGRENVSTPTKNPLPVNCANTTGLRRTGFQSKFSHMTRHLHRTGVRIGLSIWQVSIRWAASWNVPVQLPTSFAHYLIAIFFTLVPARTVSSHFDSTKIYRDQMAWTLSTWAHTRRPYGT